MRNDEIDGRATIMLTKAEGHCQLIVAFKGTKTLKNVFTVSLRENRLLVHMCWAGCVLLSRQWLSGVARI